MPINNITQTISELPAAGSRGVDVQSIFVVKQEDFQDHLQGTTVTELNTLKDQLNSRIGEINSTATTMNEYATSASSSASTATTKAGEASTSATAALNSKNQASTFATNSSNSATKASQWADNNYNVAVEAGKYSAKHWATEAQNVVLGTVKLTGNQTIAGIKTFTSSPIVPTPTTDFQVATKKYVDEAKAIDNINDLATYSGNGSVIVKDINRGGTFVSKTGAEIDPNTGSVYTVNGGTVFAKLGGGFWVRQYSGSVNAKWFGAKGDGVTDDTDSLNMAMIYIANYKRGLYIPSGVYLTRTGVQPPNGAYIYGDGKYDTVIRLTPASFGGDLEATPMRIQNVAGVTVKGMTLDGNYQNRTTLPTGTFSYGGTSLLIQASTHVICEDIYATNPYRHSIDVTGSAYSRAENPDLHVEVTSNHVWLNRCEADKGRDDNITTHQCYNVWITDCYSHDPLGGYVDNNNNCLEIDDGSRHIYVSNFVGRGGYEGVQIKGHANAAAPYDIHMNNIVCINNCVGFECRHTDFYGTPYSNTAKGIYVTNLTIIAPAISPTWEQVGYTEPSYCVWLRSYQNVQIKNLNIYLDDSQANIAGEYLPTQKISNVPLKITDGLRQATIDGLYIYGSNWNGEGNRGAVHFTTAPTKDVTIVNANLIDIGGRAIYATHTVSGLKFDKWTIRNSGDALPIAYYIGNADAFVGQMTIEGYESRLSTGKTKLDISCIPMLSGYQDNNSTVGTIQINSNLSASVGTSIQASSSGALGMYFNNTQYGASFTNAGATIFGYVCPNATNEHSLGEAARLWTTVYASTGSINTSDERYKQQFRSQTDREKLAALEIKNSICLFKFNDAVDLKGDSARWHVGVKAQKVISIMEAHNLDPFEYGFVCYDGWEEQEEIKDEKGNITQEYRPAGNKYAIRYEELLCFIISAV